MPPPCMCTLEVCAQLQGLRTLGARVDTSTFLAGTFISRVFYAKALCTSNSEKLGRDSGAGCHSSDVCSTYRKSFLRVSGRAGRCAVVPGGMLLTPSLSTSLQKGLEGQSRASPGFSSQLPSAAWDAWLGGTGCLC